MNRIRSAALRDLAENLRARPGRAALSFLALAIGMTVLVVVAAVLGGLDLRARQIVEDLGADVFVILPDHEAASTTQYGPLRMRHADILRANLPGAHVSVARIFENVSSGDDRPGRVIATDHVLTQVRPWRLIDGRFLDERDMRLRERVVLVSERIFQEKNLRIGDSVTLGQTALRVIGIVAIDTDALETEVTTPALLPGERVFLVPHTLDAVWFGRAGAEQDLLSAIYVRAPGSSGVARTVEQAQRLLEQPDLQAPPVSFITADTLLSRIRALQAAIRYTAGSVAVLCLALGGTTLMSLLIANVRERVSEIGLRRALGATRADVASLFVLEAIGLTLASACAGLLGGLVLLWAARELIPVPLRLDFLTLFSPLFVAIVAGIAFSYWPARLAARIAPAEALRNE